MNARSQIRLSNGERSTAAVGRGEVERRVGEDVERRAAVLGLEAPELALLDELAEQTA